MTDLADYATKRQLEYHNALLKHGTRQKAAIALGVDASTLSKALVVLAKKAAKSGWAPEFDLTHPVPLGYSVKGASTLYDSTTGLPKIQWIKTDRDKADQLEQLEQAIDNITANVKPFKKVKSPKVSNKDLLVVYPMGDPHIGMYAWHKETGKDFDCDTAREELLKAMQYLSDGAPAAETAVILNLGDFFHADNASNTTTRSSNQLDVDTRWPRVLELGIHAMIDCINLALLKHKNVVVLNEIGNHDTHTATMLSLCLKAWFRNEPRCDIRDTIAKHDYYQFGKVLIGTTHGDTVNAGTRKQLGALMAHDMPVAWGETRFRYWYQGHIHNSNREELVGCLWESFRNLAPNDNWHQSQGYRSGSDMVAIVHHRDHGEVSRLTCNISMVDTL